MVLGISRQLVVRQKSSNMDGAGTSREGNGASVSRDGFQRLLAAITGTQGQLSTMKAELSKERAEADERLVKQLKLESNTIFKKKGNERQYKFNAEVQDKLQAASTSHSAGG